MCAHAKFREKICIQKASARSDELVDLFLYGSRRVIIFCMIRVSTCTIGKAIYSLHKAGVHGQAVACRKANVFDSLRHQLRGRQHSSIK